MSGYHETVLEERGLDASGLTILEKPVRAELLDATLLAAVEVHAVAPATHA